MTTYHGRLPKGCEVILDPDEHHAYAWFGLDEVLSNPAILWGIPSILRDFDLVAIDFGSDPTLADGSSVELLELFK